jgi:hypothetical protein
VQNRLPYGIRVQVETVNVSAVAAVRAALPLPVPTVTIVIRLWTTHSRNAECLLFVVAFYCRANRRPYLNAQMKYRQTSFARVCCIPFQSTCGYRAVDFQWATTVTRAKGRRRAESQPQFRRDTVLNACELECRG